MIELPDEVDTNQARLWLRRLKNGMSVEQPIAGNERAGGAVGAAVRQGAGAARPGDRTDGPAGSGVQPLGILRMIALLSSLGDTPAEQVFCCATGNTARMRKLATFVIPVSPKPRLR